MQIVIILGFVQKTLSSLYQDMLYFTYGHL